MNQERIGKFIAENRKKQNLTQEQLAEKLNVSKNAVSKWERGICLMNMSLLKPLSEILDVSVNEILSGERITDKQIKEKSEENINNLAELNDLDSAKKGVLAISAITFFLIIYCGIKDIDFSGYVSLICGYNGLFHYSKYKYNKDSTTLTTAILFLIAMTLNLIAFVVRTL